MKDTLEITWTEMIYDFGDLSEVVLSILLQHDAAVTGQLAPEVSGLLNRQHRELMTQWHAAPYPRKTETSAEPLRKFQKNHAMSGVIRENHEKRVKKGDVPARLGAHGVVCANKQATP